MRKYFLKEEMVATSHYQVFDFVYKSLFLRVRRKDCLTDGAQQHLSNLLPILNKTAVADAFFFSI